MRLNHKQGAAAEDAALAFLLGKGCSLLARNWHCAYGEIDLIVKNGGTIVFVEVKYRKNRGFGGAAYSISPSKIIEIATKCRVLSAKARVKPCALPPGCGTD